MTAACATTGPATGNTGGNVAGALAGSGPLVSITHVSKLFANGTLAIQDANITVFPGEFLSILGPSGCGKSTLLRLIAGLGSPSTGTIDWGQRDASGRGRVIGFVFQEPTLMPWGTAVANVATPLRLKGANKHEALERARDMLHRVGLGGFVSAYPRELSGGMRMRVSIARALVTEPQILLMDEPFAALDEITRNRLNDDLLALWLRQRFTVVFVTHSVFESVYLSQRIIVMAARPGRTFADLQVGSAHPRDPQFRTSAEYAGLCRTVSEALRGAIAA